MKTISLVYCALLSLILFETNAQTMLMEKDLVRRITVSGSAEMEVVPNQITFAITLKEYFKDEKTQKEKMIIGTLEKQLIAALAEAGIPKESLSIGNVSGYKEYIYRRAKPTTYLTNKQYELLLPDLKRIDILLAKLDQKGIESTHIAKTEHSKIQQYRKEIKIKALQAAKEKAQYLLEGIGEKLGDPIEINEMEDYYAAPVYAAQSNIMMKSEMAADAAMPEPSTLEYQKIKLTYKMNAVFRIK